MCASCQGGSAPPVSRQESNTVTSYDDAYHRQSSSSISMAVNPMMAHRDLPAPSMQDDNRHESGGLEMNEMNKLSNHKGLRAATSTLGEDDLERRTEDDAWKSIDKDLTLDTLDRSKIATPNVCCPPPGWDAENAAVKYSSRGCYGFLLFW